MHGVTNEKIFTEKQGKEWEHRRVEHIDALCQNAVTLQMGKCVYERMLVVHEAERPGIEPTTY